MGERKQGRNQGQGRESAAGESGFQLADGAALAKDVFLGGAMECLETPVFVKDEEHRWVYLNTAACTVLGQPREVLLGGRDSDYYDLEYSRFLWDKDEHVLRTGETISYEARVHWHGRIMNIVSRKSLYTDPQGRRFVVGVLLDVSDIRATEGSLRDSEKRLRIILEKASVGVLVIADGKILFANPYVISFGGYPPDDIYSLSLGEFIHPDDRKMVTDFHRARMLGQDVPTHYMTRVLTKQGQTRWVGISGAKIEWEGRTASLNFLVDLTELKSAQDELERSERQLREVIDLVPHMIYARDAQGRYLLANETMAAACGSTVEALTGLRPEDLPDVAVCNDALAEVERQALEKGCPVSAPSLRYTDASGELLLLQCSAMPIAWGGQGGSVLGVCTDITVSSRMRERLERLNETLLHFGSDPLENIQALVALCGEATGGVCALYSRIVGDTIEAVGMWNAPQGFKARDDAAWHICTSVARKGDTTPTCIRGLQDSPWAEIDPNVRAFNLQTYVGLPVKTGSSRMGSLCVVHVKDIQPSAEDLWLLSVVASAISVEEHRLAAMNALRQREGALRAMFDATPDQIMLLTTEGIVQAVNAHAAKRIGLDSAEIVGRNIFTLPKAGRQSRWEKQFQQVRATGEPLLYSEQRGERYFEHRISPVFEASGNVGGFALYSCETTEEKKAQRKLMESEDRFRATFEQSAVGLSHSDLDGRFLLVNDKLCEILGYSREELLGRRFKEITHPGELSENLRLHHKMHAGGLPSYTMEKRYIRKDGSPVWVNVTVSLIQDEAGRHKYNCTVVEDISLRKQIEKALLRRDAVLEAVSFAAEKFLQAPDWSENIHEVLESFGTAAVASRAYIFRNVVDSAGRLCMEMAFEWNAAGVALKFADSVPKVLPYVESGYSALQETLSNKRPFYGLVSELPKAFRTAASFKGVLSLAVVPVFVQGQWWGFIGFDDSRTERQWLPAELEALMAGADILGNAVARRRAEAALMESERKFRIIAETVEDVFWISTPDRRTLLYLSPAYERYLGNRDEVFKNNRKFFNTVHPGDRKRLLEHYQLPMQGAREIEYCLTRKDGKPVWVRERAFPVLDDEGRMEWLAGISTDVTERHEAEESIRRSLAEKELLLQEVHHRVKNNLQIISSLLDMAGRRIADPKAREIMRDTQSKIHSMAMIHLQLYGYERFDSIDIASYAKLLTWQLSQMYNATNVTPQFKLEETFLPLSKAIPCGLVLSEVLSNVFKHAFPGGRSGTLLLSVGTDEQGRVALSIKDDGVGMPEGCDPQQSKSVGLKLMTNIVQFQLCGELTFETDNGTRVSLTFNREDQGAAT